MLNIVIPMAANIYFDSTDYFYPKPLIEVKGKPIIQLVVESLRSLSGPMRFIFILNRKDDSKFHLQDTLRLITENQCEVVLLEKQSRGAACSVLMAIQWIAGPDPVVVANGDQTFNFRLSDVIANFQKRNLAAGVICFDSVHPRWSYVRLDDQGLVIEAAEKRPLSRNAIAGFYYFKEGKEFVRLSMKHIEKGSEVDGQYYVAPILNEYVLENQPVGTYMIDNSRFRSYYSIQKIEEAQREAG